MKILTIAFILLAAICNAQNPYATLTYDSLVIYNYADAQSESGNIQKTDDSYRFKVKPLKSVRLNAVESKEFSNRIGLKSSYGESVASCFDPHFAAFYFKGGKVIANVEICISCNRLDPSIEIPAQLQLPQKTDEGEVYYLGTGFSKEFRKYMKRLITEYGFSHAPDGESIYD